MKASIINEVISKINDKMPPAFKDCSDSFEKNLKCAMESVLSKLDLVTREEFDIQCELLAKTREKLEELEAKVDKLVKKKDSPKASKK